MSCCALDRRPPSVLRVATVNKDWLELRGEEQAERFPRMVNERYFDVIVQADELQRSGVQAPAIGP